MSTTILASDPSITYFPQNAWTPDGDGTMTTNNAGASVQLTSQLFRKTQEKAIDTAYHSDFWRWPPFSKQLSTEYSCRLGTIPPTVGNHEPTRPVSNYTLDHEPPVLPQVWRAGDILVITAINNQIDFILGSIVYDSNTLVSNESIPSPSESITEHTLTSSPTISFATIISAVGAPATNLFVGTIVGGVIAALVVLVEHKTLFRMMRLTPSPFCLVCRQRDAPTEGRHGLESPSSTLSTFLHAERKLRTIWELRCLGSIPHSVSTVSAVFGDRSQTSSFVDEKKGGSESANSPPVPNTIALNPHSTVFTTGTRSTGPPPSYTYYKIDWSVSEKLRVVKLTQSFEWFEYQIS
ncbi:hypothetical protein BT96DRAFT_996112 [Gymnopus androsaceus JB14]|uniref:Uncharacterized protein n=1 Tax=Gymnopus androsaceus JB14 TaxID=1447944 RepID=A0A6A4HGR5_9AGAR|nr:hypothetical protein BT96DRAFT_996112 [Gymnopus androsaceus JB14]